MNSEKYNPAKQGIWPILEKVVGFGRHLPKSLTLPVFL
jgi:hypothetical protein